MRSRCSESSSLYYKTYFPSSFHLESKPWLTGKFEHEKTLVTVTYDSTVNRYQLKLGGKVGHLDTTNDERIMSVDKDCPIFVDGHKSARFTHKGIDYNSKLYKRVSI